MNVPEPSLTGPLLLTYEILAVGTDSHKRGRRQILRCHAGCLGSTFFRRCLWPLQFSKTAVLNKLQALHLPPGKLLRREIPSSFLNDGVQCGPTRGQMPWTSTAGRSPNAKSV